MRDVMQRLQTQAYENAFPIVPDLVTDLPYTDLTGGVRVALSVNK